MINLAGIKAKKKLLEQLDYFADKFKEKGITEEEIQKEVKFVRDEKSQRLSIQKNS